MSMRVLFGSLLAALTVASATVSAGEFVEIDSGTKRVDGEVSFGFVARNRLNRIIIPALRSASG